MWNDFDFTEQDIEPPVKGLPVDSEGAESEEELEFYERTLYIRDMLGNGTK